MSRERRIGRRLWHLVVDDPYRKLVAIGLAALLWIFIDSRITDRDDRNMQLIATAEVGPAEFDQLVLKCPPEIGVVDYYDGDREIKRVDIELRGPRFRIDALAGPLSLLVRPFAGRSLARVVDGELPAIETVDFDARDIIRNARELQGIDIVMNPPRVTVKYQRFSDYTLAEPGGVTEFLGIEEARLRRDTLSFTPSSVKVIGPAAAIEQFKTRDRMFRVTLRDLRGDEEVSGALEILGGAELGLRWDVQPTVRARLKPKRDTFEFKVQVLVDDLSLPVEERGRWRPVQDSMLVKVSLAGALAREVAVLGSADARRQLAAESLRLVVHFEPPLSGTGLGEQAQLTPELMLVGRRATMYPDRSEFSLVDVRPVTLRRTP